MFFCHKTRRNYDNFFSASYTKLIHDGCPIISRKKDGPSWTFVACLWTGLLAAIGMFASGMVQLAQQNKAKDEQLQPEAKTTENELNPNPNQRIGSKIVLVHGDNRRTPIGGPSGLKIKVFDSVGNLITTTFYG